MAKQYVVVGQVATISVRSSMGVEQQMLYQGAILPPGCDPEKIKHLISVGLVAEVTDPDDPATNPAAQRDVIGTGPLPTGDDGSEDVDLVVDDNGNPVDNSDPVDETPAEGDNDGDGDEPADVNLPPDGSEPAESATKATWVEYAVGKGMDRTEATKASKKDLIEALKTA